MGQRSELFESKAFNRAIPDTLNWKQERGQLTHLLIVFQGTTIRFGDRISAGLRRDGGKQEKLIDDISLNFFAQMTDLKFGLPAYGSVYAADQGNGAITTENEISGKTMTAAINAVLIPMGSLYLDNAELTVTLRTINGGSSVETTNGGSGLCKAHVYGVSTGLTPAHLLTYESSWDLEAKHSQVRELYLATRDGSSLFASASAVNTSTYTDDIYARDVNVQLDVDGTSLSSNLYGYGALTTIFGELNRPASSMVRMFQDDDNLPSSFWCKISGQDREECELIIVKEVLTSAMTLEGYSAQIDDKLKKAQSIEKIAPEAAKAYQMIGVAEPSANLAAVKEALPTSI